MPTVRGVWLAILPPGSHNKYDRSSMMDASVMVLWYLSRNCKLPLLEIQRKQDCLAEFRRGPRHSGCATPWQPPVAGPAVFMHDGAVHTAHCEYQGPAVARSRGSFGLAEQKFWFESDRKFAVLHQTINNANTIVCNVADLRFEDHRMWNDIPRASTRHLIHSCLRRVPNLLAARGDFIGYWRFILQLWNISALNATMNLLGLKLDFSYPLNPKFRSIACNKYTPGFNAIYRRYAHWSQVYTYQNSYKYKTIII